MWGPSRDGPASGKNTSHLSAHTTPLSQELETLGVDVGEPVTKLPTFESECVKHCISVQPLTPESCARNPRPEF